MLNFVNLFDGTMNLSSSLLYLNHTPNAYTFHHRCGNNPVTNCGACGALEHVNGLCGLEFDCQLVASNSVFGDPCPGVRKYLEITYDCITLSKYLLNKYHTDV